MSERIAQTGRLQEELMWRRQIFENVTRISVGVAVALLVLFVVLGLLDTMIQAWPLAGAAAVSMVFSLVSMILSRRGYLQPAVVLYIVGLTLTTFAGINFTGGITGPLVILLLLFPILAGQLGGNAAIRWITGIVMVFWVVAVALEVSGAAVPVQLPAGVSRIISYVIFLGSLLAITVIVGIFVRRGQQGMVAAYERERALAESNRLAEASVEAERESRQREARSALHLRETVAGYAEYLSRVAAGDYTARVDVGELDEDVEGDPELHALGEYLNTTVDTLVVALTQAREVQRRYTEQSWEVVVKAGRVQPGFTYRQNQMTPEAEWLPQMAQAVDSGVSVAQGEGAAVPLVVNRQVVGVIGGLHPDGRAWTAEELSLIEDVTGQLAQTIESLRLFDDVQRRAAREQLSAQVTARIRESLDMETVLRTAVNEMRQALGLEGVIVQLARPEAARDVDTPQ